jgi:formiminotetrahydrofolate cyclodeaminase
MENLIDYSCKDFISDLASDSSAPGGGSAAALAAAIGVALGEMVGSLTVGKASYSNVEAEIQAAKAGLEQIRRELLETVQADAEGFQPLAQAYKLPVGASDREKIIEQATATACAAPVKIVDLACKAIDYISIMADKGSRMVLSDAGCAATLIKAAMDAAALNVYINTKSLNDRALASQLNQHCMEAQVRYGAVAQQIYSVVMAKLIN